GSGVVWRARSGGGTCRPANAGPWGRGGAFWAGGWVGWSVPPPAMLASTWPSMTLAIDPMRRMERPLGSTLLPGRVSPKPSTMASSPRTTASTRPGAPELSHITAPAMDAASLSTISPARAALADAPAASIAKITAGRYLFNLGVMALASLGCLSQDSMDERGGSSSRRQRIVQRLPRG